jgi:hypothetical protein
MFANQIDMGDPIHTLIICGELTHHEEAAYDHFNFLESMTA